MRHTALGAGLIVLVLVLGVWVYKAYQKNSTRSAVLSSVKDTSKRLHASVTAPPGGRIDFDAHARAIEAHAAGLRHRDTSAVRPLADTADDYLVTAREIVRRRAAMHGSHERLLESVEVLSRHVQNDRGAADWTQQAVRLKQVIDRDMREYRIASES